VNYFLAEEVTLVVEVEGLFGVGWGVTLGSLWDWKVEIKIFIF
jgi:hypothetical protein